MSKSEFPMQKLLEQIHNLSGLLTGVSVSVSCCLAADTIDSTRPFLSNLVSLAEEAQNELKKIRESLREIEVLALLDD